MVSFFELILWIVVIGGGIFLCSISSYSFRMNRVQKDHPSDKIPHVIINMWNFIRQSKVEPTLAKTKKEYEDFKSSYNSVEQLRYRGGATSPREFDKF